MVYEIFLADEVLNEKDDHKPDSRLTSILHRKSILFLIRGLSTSCWYTGAYRCSDQ